MTICLFFTFATVALLAVIVMLTSYALDERERRKHLEELHASAIKSLESLLAGL